MIQLSYLWFSRAPDLAQYRSTKSDSSLGSPKNGSGDLLINKCCKCNIALDVKIGDASRWVMTVPADRCAKSPHFHEHRRGFERGREVRGSMGGTKKRPRPTASVTEPFGDQPKEEGRERNFCSVL